MNWVGKRPDRSAPRGRLACPAPPQVPNPTPNNHRAHTYTPTSAQLLVGYAVYRIPYVV